MAAKVKQQKKWSGYCTFAEIDSTMFIQQLYTSCLSEAAYYIESEGECGIIDPMRDTDVYLQLIRDRKTELKYIFETHIHADFISGHLELSQQTGAPIVFGPEAALKFPAHIAKDKEQFKIGKLTLEVLHTPGHTLESCCYLLKDENGKEHCLFTGDTLFIGDVGRPDLAQEGHLSAQELAGALYDSIQTKIATRADDLIIYPAHGAGSACGKNISTETFSTLGEQKNTNYALQQVTKESFIKAVTQGLESAPSYFPLNAKLNQEGYKPLSEILEKSNHAISAVAVNKLREDANVVLLDTRPALLFTEGFVPGSINISLDGRFAEWAGTLLPYDKQLILICEEGKETESIVRLARVGFEQVVGYLEGGYHSWVHAGYESDLIINVEADELAMDLPHDEHLLVLDVRKETEFAEGHVKNAANLPLQKMNDPGLISDISDRDNLYLHCGGGVRSIIAASLLKKEGFHNLRNVLGGWKAIQKEKIPTEKETSLSQDAN